jgi:hypothetical protein
VNAQLIRIKQDRKELEFFLNRLKLEGDREKSGLIQGKIHFITKAIARLENTSKAV